MSFPIPKMRTAYTHACDATLPKLAPDFYVNRPKTPSGNCEYTPLTKTYLDTRDTTENERAYTRAQLSLLATTQAAKQYNDIMEHMPPTRRVDIRPMPIGFKSLCPVPDPENRENGICITRKDLASSKKSEHAQTLADGSTKPSDGCSSIVLHNPFIYLEQHFQPDHLQLHHIALAPNNPAAFAAICVGLAHELGHAQHCASGATPTDNDLIETMITKYEHLNGFIENKVRGELGLPKRADYSQPVTNHTGLENNAQNKDASGLYY